MRVALYTASQHLAGLHSLMNWHMAAVIAGWELSPAYIEQQLQSNPEQPVLDPWVIERATLCVMDQGSVVAAAHLLRYGSGPEVGEDYRGIGEIAWALHFPSNHAAGVTLLAEARQHIRAWGVRSPAASFNLAGILFGVPSSWPHVRRALAEAGFRVQAGDYGREVIRHGPVPAEEPGQLAPDLGLRVLSRTGAEGIRFGVLDGTKEVGYCEARPDLTRGGLVPALARWGEISDFEVAEPWRGRGIGTWLLGRVCAALTVAGRDRVVLIASDDAQGQRAGHLFERFGWPVVAHYDKLWLPEGDHPDQS